MTNIAITFHCNRSCGYCFAQVASTREIGALSHMSRSTFVRALDFVGRSDVDQIRLLGGEPTLHPDFVSFLELALEREKPIRVFSNGSIPEATLRFVEELPADRILFVINLTASMDDEVEHNAVRSALARLGKRAMLGVNVSLPSQALGLSNRADGIGHLLELIDEHELLRNLRVGLAHPCVGFENAHLRPEQYAAAGRGILELAERATERAVRLTLDCGFVPCMVRELPDNGFEEIAQQLRGNCSPILDILPDGQVIPCFPLARVCSENLDDAESAATLRTHFGRRLAVYRELGIFKACAACAFRAHGLCSGGCVAAAMRRLRTPSFELLVQTP
jgi:radical SAM protein with 4Fe4S-binding SPASM domain